MRSGGVRTEDMFVQCLGAAKHVLIICLSSIFLHTYPVELGL